MQTTFLSKQSDRQKLTHIDKISSVIFNYDILQKKAYLK